MIICVKIGERETIKTESHSWTTSRFTWGEGYQETDHVRTTTFFSTTIKLYVDNLDSYVRKNGLTSDLEIGYIPSINTNPLCLSGLTGMMIVSNYRPSWTIAAPIPGLSAGLYVYIQDEGQAENHSFLYERIKITDCIDNLLLARTIIAKTSEQNEVSY